MSKLKAPTNNAAFNFSPIVTLLKASVSDEIKFSFRLSNILLPSVFSSETLSSGDSDCFISFITGFCFTF